MRTGCIFAAGWLCLVLACHAATPAVPAAPVTAAAEAAPRWSQLTEIGFQHLSREQGLPNANVTAIAQDGDGFLWVGTSGGLARWDGHRFRVYQGEPTRPGALRDSMIQALRSDAAGRLWVGTAGAGLLRYDRHGERFVALPAGPQALSHASVRGLADDGAGGLWVATEAGLDRVLASGEVRQQQAQPGVGRTVRAVLRDTRGRVWAASAAGLLRSQDGVAPFESVHLSGDAEARVEPTTLLDDSAGRVWVGTRAHGVFVIAGDGTVSPVVEQPARPGVSPLAQHISGLLEAAPGEVWVATAGDGLVVIDVTSGGTRRARYSVTRPSSLADNLARTLFRDRSGLVWVGTNQGLSRYDPTQRAVRTLYGARASDGNGEHEPLSHPDVSWILPMPQGRVWFATQGNGVDILDPVRGVRVAALRPDPQRPETALPRDIVLALERAGDDTVFIATRRGLYRARTDAGAVSRVRLAGRDPAEPTWALAVEGSTLWLGGERDGLWRLDLRSGRAQPVAYAGPQRLGDARIIVLRPARHGGLWVGTRNGLHHYDPASNRVQRVGGTLGTGFIATLHHDRRGRLWVGRYGGGIDILPAGAAALAGREVLHLGAAQGLPDDNVNVILEDARGRVWVSTDNGLAVIDPDALHVQPLHRAEGVMFPTYWTGSGARTEHGELLFGGSGGVSIVRPEQPLATWTHQPAVLVSELRLGGRAVAPGRYLREGARLDVQPDANNIVVEFSSDDFSAPERNHHAHRLDGIDADWVDTEPDHRRASYTNLPPGNYMLRLRGSNRNGVWSETALALPLRVLPAWHQTWWFRAALVLLLALGVMALMQWRTRVLRQRRAELEAKVQERTAELEKVTRALEEKTRVLEQSTQTDPLTGLRNRRFLTEHIDTVIAASLRRAHDPHPSGSGDTDNLFLLVDADHFKAVNDIHGHAAGDAVLVQFAQRLRVVMRESDLLVRWGGEEFLIVARDTDRSRAEELAERIRADIASVPFALDEGREIGVTCSIGVACMPFVERDARQLSWQDVVKLADVALLAAKRMGRNGWIALHATDTTRVDGLVARVQAAPQQAVAGGEIRLSGSRPAAAMVQALGALQREDS